MSSGFLLFYHIYEIFVKMEAGGRRISGGRYPHWRRRQPFRHPAVPSGVKEGGHEESKRYVRICAALLCAVLCLSVNVAPAMAAKVTQADIDALKGNAASLDKKQKEIQSKLNGLKNDKAAAVQKKTLLDKRVCSWLFGSV